MSFTRNFSQDLQAAIKENEQKIMDVQAEQYANIPLTFERPSLDGLSSSHPEDIQVDFGGLEPWELSSEASVANDGPPKFSGVTKAISDAIPYGIGTAVSLINNAVKTMHKPQYMTDQEWNEKQTPLIKKIDNIGDGLQKLVPQQKYESYSPEWWGQTLTTMAPTSVGLGLAALTGLKSRNPSALSQSGEYAAMNVLGRGIGAAKNVPAAVNAFEKLSELSPTAAKIAANAPAVLSKYAGNVLSGAYIQAPAAYAEAQVEGNDAYNEAIESGLSHEQASQIRNRVVELNIKLLTGSNAFEIATAFTELPFKGPQRILRNVLGESARYGIAGLQNAGEEVGQENVKRSALIEALDKEIQMADATTPEGEQRRKNLMEARSKIPEAQINPLNWDDDLMEQAAGGFGAGILFNVPGTISRVKNGDFSKEKPAENITSEKNGTQSEQPVINGNSDLPQMKTPAFRSEEDLNNFEVEAIMQAIDSGDISAEDGITPITPKGTELLLNLEQQRNAFINSIQQTTLPADNMPHEYSVLQRPDLPSVEPIQPFMTQEQKQQELERQDSIKQKEDRLQAEKQLLDITGQKPANIITPAAQSDVSIVLPGQDGPNAAGIQALAELRQRLIPQKAEPLPDSWQAGMRRRLANAVQRQDLAAAANIARDLGFGSRVKLYENSVIQPNVRERLTIDELKRADNYNKLNDLSKLFVDVLDHHKAPINLVQSEIESTRNRMVADYINLLRGQMKQGVVSRGGSMNYKWYRDALETYKRQMTSGKTGKEYVGYPKKEDWEYILRQTAEDHLRNGYTDPTYGPQISEQDVDFYNDMEAALNGIKQIREEVTPALDEYLRANESSGTKDSRSIQTAAKDAIPVAREIGKPVNDVAPIIQSSEKASVIDQAEDVRPEIVDKNAEVNPDEAAKEVRNDSPEALAQGEGKGGFNGSEDNRNRLKNKLLEKAGKKPKQSKKMNIVDDSDAALQDALKELQKELQNISSNPVFNPALMSAAFKVGAIHMQRGINSFTSWSEVMLQTVGNKIEPFLNSVWKSITSWPVDVKYDSDLANTMFEYVGVLYQDGITGKEEVKRRINEDIGSEYDNIIDAIYNGVSEWPGFKNDVAEKTEAEVQSKKEGEVNGRDSSADMERNSTDLSDRDGMGSAILPDGPAGNSRSDGGRGDEARSDGAGSDRRAGVLDSGSLGSGSEGNKGIRSKSSLDKKRHSGSDLFGGSDNTGLPGVPSDPRAAEAVIESSADRTETSEKLAAQKKADSISVKVADLDNIRDTLPFLMPEQQEDVHFAEQRFKLPDGYGVLFTNGTGTGKTYSGLGVVKRFAMQGKDNILIAAPNSKIIDGWVNSGKNLNLTISKLDDTKSAGTGITITTYANLNQNQELTSRNWDLIVTDESHYLASSQNGGVTGAADNLRAIAFHRRGYYTRFNNIEKELKQQEHDAWEELRLLEKSEDEKSLAKIPVLESKAREISAKVNSLREKYFKEWDAIKPQDRPRVLFLSATPFAYVENIDYAEGFLFNYGESSDSQAYNAPDAREKFFINHFGYRMRYNKLTKPDAQVDNEVMEQQFHEWLRKQGALSGRMLSVDKDYDRKFSLVNDAIGAKIDEGLQWLWETDGGEYRELYDFVMERFKYHDRMYLLESIKSRHAVNMIKEHIALGRKVVVFHDFNKGGGFHPFKFDYVPNDIREQYNSFSAKRRDLINLNFSDLKSPIAQMKASFGEKALFFNGTVPDKVRRNNVDVFNRDDGEKSLLVVQSDAGREGISLHDTTGKHQRVLINLGMPVKPTAAIQIEGRIYRVGQKSDAIFRYLNTGTSFERYTFATKIAERATTAENLALGQDARRLREAFIDAYQLSDDYPAGAPGEGKGGKAGDRASRQEMTNFKRAISYYFGQQKKTSRSKAAEGTDYFATPEPVGLKMVEWADMKEGERALEPSAGHGAIARFFPEKGDHVMIEPSYELGPLAAMNSPARLVAERFENYHIINKFHSIIMNPPYGHGGKTAIEHVAKAFQHLYNGGRIVALIPDGGLADRRFERWMESDAAEDAYLVGAVKLPAVTFERAGTSIRTKIVIIEKYREKDNEQLNKLQQRNIDLSNADNINELFDRLENLSMPERAIKSEQSQLEVVQDQNVETVNFDLGEFKHTKTLKTLYVATPTKHLGDDFSKISKIAKQHNGWYNSFNKGGALKGFAFENAADRKAFLDEFAQDKKQDIGIDKLAVGLDPTFGKFDDVDIEAALLPYINKAKEAIPRLVRLGQHLMEQGNTTGKEWMAKMRETLGHMWNNFRSVIGSVWKEVRDTAANKRTSDVAGGGNGGQSGKQEPGGRGPEKDNRNNRGRSNGIGMGRNESEKSFDERARVRERFESSLSKEQVDQILNAIDEFHGELAQQIIKFIAAGKVTYALGTVEDFSGIRSLQMARYLPLERKVIFNPSRFGDDLAQIFVHETIHGMDHNGVFDNEVLSYIKEKWIVEGNTVLQGLRGNDKLTYEKLIDIIRSERNLDKLIKRFIQNQDSDIREINSNLRRLGDGDKTYSDLVALYALAKDTLSKQQFSLFDKLFEQEGLAYYLSENPDVFTDVLKQTQGRSQSNYMEPKAAEDRKAEAKGQMTFRPAAKDGKTDFTEQNKRMMAGLEKRGWKRIENQDGSITYQQNEQQPPKAADVISATNTQVRAGAASEKVPDKLEFKFTKPNVQKISRRSIRDKITELFAPVRWGRAASSNEFKEFANVIRSQKAYDFPGLLKSIGELLDNQFRLSELPHAIELKGGVGQFFIDYVTGNTAQYPNFTNEFEKAIGSKIRDVRLIQDMMYRWYNQTSRERVSGVISWDQKEKLTLRSLSAKSKEQAGKALAYVYRQLVERRFPIKQAIDQVEKLIGKKLPMEQNPYIQALLTRGLAGKANAMLGIGKNKSTNAQAVRDGLKAVHPGVDFSKFVPLSDIMSSIGADRNEEVYQELFEYVVSKHMLTVANKKEAPLDYDDWLNTVEDARPEIVNAGRQIVDFSNTLMDIMVDYGVVSKGKAEGLRKAYPNYVPLMRVFEEAAYEKLGDSLKEMVGSVRDIVNPAESIVHNVFKMLEQAERNKVKQLFADIADNHANMGWLIEEVPEIAYAEKEVALEDVAETIIKKGETFVEYDSKNEPKWLNTDKDGNPVDEKGNELIITHSDNGKIESIIAKRPVRNGASDKDSVFKVLVNGKAKFYQIGVPEVYKSMMEQEVDTSNLFLKFLSMVVRVARAGFVSLNPAFLAVNVSRDLVTSYVNSPSGYMPKGDFFRGMMAIAKQDKLWWEYVSSGTAMADFYSTDRNFAQEAIKKIRKQTALGKFSPMHMIELLERVGQMVESAPRVGEYIREKEQGFSLPERAFNARDLTIDFSKGGPASVVWNRVAVFSKVTILDWDKVFRVLFTGGNELKEKINDVAAGKGSVKDVVYDRTMQAWVKHIVLLTIPSLLLWWMYKDDDRYKKLPQWRKDMFWNVPINDTFTFSVPKPFLAGTMFATMPVRFMEWAVQNNPDAFKQVGKLLTNQLPTLLPTAITPVYEHMSNYSLFSDKSIVPQGEKTLPPERQYGPSTTLIARKVGEIFGVSPRFVDNYIRGYTGGVGTTITESIDLAYGKYENAPMRYWQEWPVVRRFFTQNYRNADNIGDFYKQLEELEQAHKVQLMDTAAATGKSTKELRDEVPVPPDLKMYRLASKALQDNRDQSQTILVSQTIDSKSKREQIDQLNREAVIIADQALKGEFLPEKKTQTKNKISTGSIFEKAQKQLQEKQGGKSIYKQATDNVLKKEKK
ncbi:helicase-like protein [Anaerospora hongkongensis]|uniref:Helicase-like protein n=1 Tax=Anaerospora hongkongensis TaxID=244830 RepID=A0A4V2Q929_9FIRM|nr:LPD38 domain-containing protein [Anaerospora hongkongensis]TCL39943.1 helicase-like protein [Anaerospora hongkongensis]